jgi:hypothetical protein
VTSSRWRSRLPRLASPPGVTVETPTPEGASIAVLWASPSADTVIVDWGVAKNTEPPGQLGVVSHGTFTPLPSVPSFLYIPGPAW